MSESFGILILADVFRLEQLLTNSFNLICGIVLVPHFLLSFIVLTPILFKALKVSSFYPPV